MGTFKNPDVWKQNLAYQIGDFVLYNGTVYMAIKPVPAGTAMSADYWYAFDEGAIVPTGEISITENGEVNVAQYATANVNVEGGGGGGETPTTDVYLWNTNEDEYANELPNMVTYISGFEDGTDSYTQLQFEPITTEHEETTFYGVKLKDCPAGALFNALSFRFNSVWITTISFGYSDNNIGFFPAGSSGACPMPLDGLYVVGDYTVEGGGPIS